MLLPAIPSRSPKTAPATSPPAPRSAPTRTTEADGTHSADRIRRSGDDGVTAAGPLVVGQTTNITINVQGGGGFVNAWADLNRDGDFNDPGEQFLTNLPVSVGNNTIPFAVPADFTPGNIVIRYRLTSAGSVASPSPTGLLPDGEVEDYVGTIVTEDFGDAPTGYPVTLAENGARHIATGPTLGATRTSEADGTHSATASADTGDDGVTAAGPLVVGQTTNITINVQGGSGFVNAWADLNRDGDFNDPGEQFLTNFAVSVGDNVIPFAIPANFTPGQIVTRYRLTSAAVESPSPTGLLPDGEVEDYVGTIVPPTFVDHFDRSNSPNLGPDWTAQVGSVGIQTNIAISTGASNVQTFNGFSQADVIVTTDVDVSRAGVAAGVIARYAGSGDRNMYWAGLQNINNVSVASICGNVDGVWTQLSQGAVVLGTSTRLPFAGSVRFEVFGTTLKLFVNRALVVVANDSALTAGGLVGIRSNGGAIFNNFVATERTPSLNTASTFSDDFATSNLDSAANLPSATGSELGLNWTEQMGGYGVAAGAVHSTSSLDLATLNAVSLTDVVASTDIALATNAAAGLVARYTGTGDQNMYWGAVFNINGQDFGYIFRNVAGTWSVLAGSSTVIGSNTAIGSVGTLRFEVLGGSLKLFLNNNLVAAAYDTVLTAAGSVGIRSNTVPRWTISRSYHTSPRPPATWGSRRRSAPATTAPRTRKIPPEPNSRSAGPNQSAPSRKAQAASRPLRRRSIWPRSTASASRMCRSPSTPRSRTLAKPSAPLPATAVPPTATCTTAESSRAAPPP